MATKEQDKIEKAGDNRIVYSTKTDDDIDGFDFKVDANVTRLRFVLEVDGQMRPMLIETGRNNFKPEQDPFVVHLK